MNCLEELEMNEGDLVEFKSDLQTEKGPSAGKIVERFSGHVNIEHSDCIEMFNVGDLIIEKETTHHRGGKLWILK